MLHLTPLVSRRAFASLLLVGAVTACAEAPPDPTPQPGPTTGSLSIAVATSGVALDPDGYSVTIGEAAPRSLAVNGTLVVADLAAGDWVVRLGGLANNCALQGDNPRSIFVPGGGSAQVSLAVTCTATTGSVNVVVATNGTALDPDGYTVALGGGQPQPLGINAGLTLTEVAAGERLLALGGVANNCAVAGGSSRTVMVPAGGSVNAAFSVSCSATTGSLSVSAATSGTALDPDGYSVTVGSSAAQPLGVNGSFTLADMAAGDVTVALTGIANNCSVSGGASRTATVPAGGSASVAFAVSCTATTGNVVVTTSTSGTQIDANGYAVAVGTGQPQGVGVNTSVTVANVAVGDRDVMLSDVAANCAVTGGNQRAVSVPAGGSVSTNYVVTCNAPAPSVVNFTFTLKEFFGDSLLTSPASITIDGTTFTAVNGVISGQLSPGLHTIGLVSNAATFDADRIELPGGAVRILFPQFAQDTITLTSDVAATIRRPSRTDQFFNFDHYLKTFDDKVRGRQMPRASTLLVYLLTAGFERGCADATPAALTEWRAFQTRLTSELAGLYTVVSQEGTTPPAQADSVLVICVGRGAVASGYSVGPLGELAGGVGYSAPANIQRRDINTHGKAYPYFQADWDGQCRVPSVFNDPLDCGANPANATEDATEFDRREGLLMGFFYGRPAAIRRVANGGATPFFTLRP